MYTNPITKKKHRSWEMLHRKIGSKMPESITRDSYEAIVGSSEFPARGILNLFKTTLEPEYCEFDKKKRGTSLNYDLYGYDPEQGVALIQARQFYRRAASHFGATRKSYLLVGRNEITGEFFRHPISAHTIRAAIKKDSSPQSPITAAQCWMWEVKPNALKSALRQGDILVVPETRIPKSVPLQGNSVLLHGSHQLTAETIIPENEFKVFALNPKLKHVKDQHLSLAATGWNSVRVARTAKAWDFSGRVGD